MKILIFSLFYGLSQITYASQVAQCLGTFVFDNSPVSARIYSENGVGRIEIETSEDKIQSETEVKISPDLTVTVENNNAFRLSFSVSQSQPASQVQAFRDGQFFVEDFYCIRVN